MPINNLLLYYFLFRSNEWAFRSSYRYYFKLGSPTGNSTKRQNVSLSSLDENHLRTTFKLLSAIDPPNSLSPVIPPRIRSPPIPIRHPKPCPLQPRANPTHIARLPQIWAPAAEAPDPALSRSRLARGRTPSWLRRSGRSAAAGAVAQPPPPLPRRHLLRVTRGTL